MVKCTCFTLTLSLPARATSRDAWSRPPELPRESSRYPAIQLYTGKHRPAVYCCSVSMFSVCSMCIFYVCSMCIFYVCSICMFYVCSMCMFYVCSPFLPIFPVIPVSIYVFPLKSRGYQFAIVSHTLIKAFERKCIV